MIRIIDYIKFSPVGGFQQIIKSGVYSYSFSNNGNTGPFVCQKGGYYGEWHGNVLELDKTGLQSLWEYKHGAKSGLEFRWVKKNDHEYTTDRISETKSNEDQWALRFDLWENDLVKKTEEEF